jgi:hypothetical protein
VSGRQTWWKRWLRDCAYGQADPRKERSYGQEAEVHVFLSPVIYARSLLADDKEIRHASSINIGARSLNTYNNFILE